MTPGQQRPNQPPAIIPPEEGLQPPWLMSFADFVSCLLACFVLLFSMVSLDKESSGRSSARSPAAPISTCRRRSRWNAA